ncbi:MAG TPA: prenyltransferase/squalene oxidase repeat-containing protein [Phycisphaerae bacterium]|nr:prenyltransferase/squalene oxidase repeat-containing protein [Phycisphaerae bacterium]
MKIKALLAVLLASCITLLGIGRTIAASDDKPLYQTDPVLAKGLNYLLANQGKDGSWVPQPGPAVTALAVKGLLMAGYSPDFPAIVNGMKFIESFHKADGGFYDQALPTYNTAIVLSTLAIFPGHKYDDQIKMAQKFLESLQAMAPDKDNYGATITPSNSWYGGWSYGSTSARPDLSNSSFAIEALHDSGVSCDDPVMKRALVFVTHCQELDTTNPLPFAKGQDDGGFIYTPAMGGESSFGDVDHLTGPSTLTSYGSMTYAGFKSMIYAGLTANDPRVAAALDWIRSHWTLESNPGSGDSKSGLFYYYLMFTRALVAFGQPEIVDDQGTVHDWRSEMQGQLGVLQQPDGSWVNKWSDRWLESTPQLVTCYCCIILDLTDRQ